MCTAHALAGADGWTLIDAGLGTEATLGWWRQVLDGLGGAVRRIVITHYHPDHLGASAALARITGAPEVVQGSLDRELSVAAWQDEDDGSFQRYLRDHGMPAELAKASARAEIATAVELAVPTRLVEQDDAVEIGGEQYRVLVLPGHADGHIALLGERSGRLLGGDVLLEEITPNVGRWPDTARDPLGRYLDTLRRVAALAPAKVLPGHGPVIDDAAARAGEIAGHHQQRLDAAEQAVAEGAATAFDAAQLIWRDEPLGFHEQRFALVEAISHLERLADEGRIEESEPGRWRPLV